MTPKFRQSRPSTPGLPLAHLDGKLRLGNGSRSLRRLLALPLTSLLMAALGSEGDPFPQRGRAWQGWPRLPGQKRSSSRGRMGTRTSVPTLLLLGRTVRWGKGRGRKLGSSQELLGVPTLRAYHTLPSTQRRVPQGHGRPKRKHHTPRCHTVPRQALQGAPGQLPDPCPQKKPNAILT